MRKLFVFTLLTLFVSLSMYGIANAEWIEYHYQGELDAVSLDTLGLDGAYFDWTVVVDTTPDYWATKTGSTDFHIAQYNGYGKISLSGTSAGAHDGSSPWMDAYVVCRRGVDVVNSGNDYLETVTDWHNFHTTGDALNFELITSASSQTWFPGVDPLELPTTVFPPGPYSLSEAPVDYWQDIMGPPESYRIERFLSTNVVMHETNPVPEPASMILLSAGLVGLAGFGRKKFKK